jgi:hypothetical protein
MTKIIMKKIVAPFFYHIFLPSYVVEWTTLGLGTLFLTLGILVRAALYFSPPYLFCDREMKKEVQPYFDF